MRNYFPKLPSGAPLHTLSKLYDVLVGFETPSFEAVYCFLRSLKGGCCSISDYLSWSFIETNMRSLWYLCNKGGHSYVPVPKFVRSNCVRNKIKILFYHRLRLCCTHSPDKRIPCQKNFMSKRWTSTKKCKCFMQLKSKTVNFCCCCFFVQDNILRRHFLLLCSSIKTDI